MRWGVRDEATDDHMTTELCMNEIRNCQRLSTGPNFVVFLGQKYGYRPIPTIIDGKESSNQPISMPTEIKNTAELEIQCCSLLLDGVATIYKISTHLFENTTIEVSYEAHRKIVLRVSMSLPLLTLMHIVV